MFGDGKSDVLAGKNADCRTALIGSAEDCYGRDITTEVVLEVVEAILAPYHDCLTT